MGRTDSGLRRAADSELAGEVAGREQTSGRGAGSERAGRRAGGQRSGSELPCTVQLARIGGESPRAARYP